MNSKGPYYQYGDTGTKYYYTSNNVKSRINAKKKAIKQMIAIKYSQKDRSKKNNNNTIPRRNRLWQ